MFENYEEMTDAEKASCKQIHRAVRKEVGCREGNLAWGFLRGFPYRRIERKTRTQKMGDGTIVAHNLPDIRQVAKILIAAMPELQATYMKDKYLLSEQCPLIAWVRDPKGAIPEPLHVTKPYVRPIDPKYDQSVA